MMASITSPEAARTFICMVSPSRATIIRSCSGISSICAISGSSFFWRYFPYSVSTIFLPLAVNSGTPRSFSSRRIAWVSAGCVICRFFALFVICFVLAASRKYRICISSIPNPSLAFLLIHNVNIMNFINIIY